MWPWNSAYWRRRSAWGQVPRRLDSFLQIFRVHCSCIAVWQKNKSVWKKTEFCDAPAVHSERFVTNQRHRNDNKCWRCIFNIAKLCLELWSIMLPWEIWFHVVSLRPLSWMLLIRLIASYFQNVLLMCCDRQLRARTTLWQSSMNEQVVPSNFLTGCQRDLNSLRRVADGLNVSP